MVYKNEGERQKKKEYYLNNREKILENKKIYYQKNKEKINERTRLYSRKWYKENKEKIDKLHKKYYKNNVEKESQRHKIFYLKNREKILEKERSYYWKNKDTIREKHKKYNKENRNKLLEYKTEWQKIRRKANPRWRLDENIGVAIWASLRDRKAGKNWEYFVDYNLNELIEHLEKKFDEKMNWNNYGSYWAVDHIKPKTLFTYNSENDMEFKQCWALKNLQPLEKIKNIKKGNRYIG